MSKLAICNLALQIACMSDRIEADDDPSLARIVCFDWYDIALRAVLLDYPWRFCEASSKLNPEVIDHPEYCHSATLPDDCIFVRDVYGTIFGDPKLKLMRWSMAGDNKVLATHPPSYCVYTAFDPENTNVDLFPSKITELIATKLATHIALPLQRVVDAGAALSELYKIKLIKAIEDETGRIRDRVDYFAPDNARFFDGAFCEKRR